MAQEKDTTVERLDLNRLLDATVLALTFLLAGLRASVAYSLFPDVTPLTGVAWREALLWVLTLAMAMAVMHRRGLSASYLAKWRRNGGLAIFLLFVTLSLLWSAFLSASIYRLIGFLCVTLIAAYFGVRYEPGEWLDVLFWVGVIVVMLSLATVILLPGYGTMQDLPYHGEWRGIFWHKNQMGAILALFNAFFALRFLEHVRARNAIAVLSGLFYILSLLLVFKSNSIGGYLAVLGLNGAIFVYWLWLRVRHRLRRVHYWLILAGAALVALLLLANLNAFLGTFGRNASLTGRVPLWIFLIREYVSQRPVLGYGFGAMWSQESFRIAVERGVGWGYQVMIGDNGFIDILLELGLVGLGLFVVVYIQMWLRAAKHTLSRLTIEGFHPLLLMGFTLVANVSFSLFFETETFVWLLMVAALFLVTEHKSMDPHRSPP